MRKRVVVLISFLVLFLMMVYAFIYSTEDSDIHTSVVTLTIPETCQLVVNSDSSKTLTQDGTSETAFAAGLIEMDASKPTLTVDANKKWKLSAKSSGFAAVGTYTKAIGDLQLKDTGGAHVTMSSYTSLSATDQEVASHTAGVSNESHPCQYKILLDWTKDIPGTYEATVTFTLATQAA